MSTQFERGFDEDELQRQLRDLLCLAVVGDHLRWVLIGDDAGELAHWLADAIAEWRAWADQVAKHLVASGVAPDGRVRSLAKDIPLNWVPDGWLTADQGRRLLADRLGPVTEWARARSSQAEDAADAKLLEVVSSGLDAQLLRLSAQR
jgi:starvation-inducible DNA-binding protein